MQLLALYALAISLSSLKDGNRHFWLLCAALFLFWGLGYANGYDWINYHKYYRCIADGVCSDAFLEFEPGFDAITRISSGAGYQLTVAIIALINIACLATFSRLIRNRSLAVLCFVLLYSWYVYVEQIRQALALSVILLGIPQLLRERTISYLFFVAAATLFHGSAIIAGVLAAFLWMPRWGRYAGIILVCAVSAIALTRLQEITQALAAFGLDSNAFARKLEYYADSDRYNRSVVGLGFFLDTALLAGLLLQRRVFETDRVTHVCYTAALLFICIALISRISIVFFRFSYYFFPFAILCFSVFFGGNHVLRTNKIRNIPLIRVIIIGFLIGQAARPFMDPVITPDIFSYQSYIPRMIRNDVDFDNESSRKCQILINSGEGNLCE